MARLDAWYTRNLPDGTVVYAFNAYTNTVFSRLYLSSKVRKYVIDKGCFYNILKNGKKGASIGSLWSQYIYTDEIEADQGFIEAKEKLKTKIDNKILDLQKLKDTIV